MSTVIKSKEPCPSCLMLSRTVNYLQNRIGAPTQCMAGHKFDDREELNAMMAQAKSAYPQFFAAPAMPTVPDPAQRAQQEIVITPEMRKAIEEIAGSPVTGAADLKGIIFAHIQDNKDKETEIRRLNAAVATMSRRAGAAAGGGSAANLAPNQVITEIPEWALEAVLAQAEHSGMQMGEWVAQEFTAYFENYFSQAPTRR